MRRACVSTVRSVSEAPKRSAARSTPTLPTRAQRDVGKDTPKKVKLFLFFSLDIKSIYLSVNISYSN
ncbi:MAG: hypothetical protein NZ455_09150 [Bacteroidia bacterium]|nr:hypothetical protein [Bacteroidia bacterium]